MNFCVNRHIISGDIAHETVQFGAPIHTHHKQFLKAHPDAPQGALSPFCLRVAIALTALWSPLVSFLFCSWVFSYGAIGQDVEELQERLCFQLFGCDNKYHLQNPQS